MVFREPFISKVYFCRDKKEQFFWLLSSIFLKYIWQVNMKILTSDDDCEKMFDYMLHKRVICETERTVWSIISYK